MVGNAKIVSHWCFVESADAKPLGQKELLYSYVLKKYPPAVDVRCSRANCVLQFGPVCCLMPACFYVSLPSLRLLWEVSLMKS